MKRYIYMLALLLVLVGLNGCSDEPREFTIHEPGEYKGTQDPLLTKSQHQELNIRFMKVQTDR